jgi:WD repeat-containing protein 45
MVGQANYLALVGGGRKPQFPQNKVRIKTRGTPAQLGMSQAADTWVKLIIWDDAKQRVVITLEFRTSVLRVRLSKSRIVIALHNSIHVFAFSTPPQKLSVFETVDNPLGLVCLGKRLVAFPGRSPGQVQLVELETGNVSIIPAHNSPLRAIDLSQDGETLATASETVRIGFQICSVDAFLTSGLRCRGR